MSCMRYCRQWTSYYHPQLILVCIFERGWWSVRVCDDGYDIVVTYINIDTIIPTGHSIVYFILNDSPSA